MVQFERTLIVADEGAKVSYLEGCTAPSYDKNQVRVGLELVVLHRIRPAVSRSDAGTWQCCAKTSCTTVAAPGLD